MGLSIDHRQAGSQPSGVDTVQAAVEYAEQAEKLSLQPIQNNQHTDTIAVEAQFITPQDPVIITADGNRLPTVPLEQAHKLNILKEELAGDSPKEAIIQAEKSTRTPAGAVGNATPESAGTKTAHKLSEGSLRRSMPPTNTHPLFPPLPLYGPPSLLRNIHCWTFRATSFFLSAGFLGVIVLGALFTNIPKMCGTVWKRLTFRDPAASRPFYEEEIRRGKLRKELEESWKRRGSLDRENPDQENVQGDERYVPAEGGPDPVICDVSYYARRVGLDIEEFQVQTEDGFIIDLWHVYDPHEYTRLDDQERADRGPELFTGDVKGSQSNKRLRDSSQKKKFPVLLMHGLLQSSGAYCVNDDDSLAFYLCKSGYDVWLGNNRCGFKPKHTLLKYSDPRMWCWNIRQMGVFDLAALVSRVLFETGFEKIGLVCHSQGTTETFVALAKEQRPELGEKLTVFCALAPAAYAGSLIGKMYFKFMRIISPDLFRVMFGIHAFIPLMMTMHSIMPPGLYGWLGYTVFSFLFDWTDIRWDRGLRNRMFQFAPVYVSAESMRWWLGRECFAKHKCILSTKEEWHNEEQEDVTGGPLAETTGQEKGTDLTNNTKTKDQNRKPKGMKAWYDKRVCPFALWVAGNDNLVDGRRLLRRFEKGREPHARIVHSKIIPEYEHLDVIWAMDAVDQVFSEIREVLWKTCNAREKCRVPKGCDHVEAWVAEEAKDDDEDDEQSSSDST
ncbi:alpha/beta-hydrolase [Hypoxylon fragiforme]|uniref:alpha/beta-hydrolase n=1 Tax=Hypoxylon fragiforme TaxID=63214 RepID=UPI0020C692D7|nr:alpha/beta-hydrolase [Hypoxylon fragiforme]KAI2614656.1 alpha/beta-hydrolase [Hypoxylon fragiforme]